MNCESTSTQTTALGITTTHESSLCIDASSTPRYVQNLPGGLDPYIAIYLTLGLFFYCAYTAYCFTRDAIKYRKGK